MSFCCGFTKLSIAKHLILKIAGFQNKVNIKTGIVREQFSSHHLINSTVSLTTLPGTTGQDCAQGNPFGKAFAYN